MEMKDIYKLIDIFDKSGISEIRINIDKTELLLRKGSNIVGTVMAPQAYMQGSQPLVHAAPVPAGAPVKSAEEKKEQALAANREIIKSPIVGSFYRSPSPDSPPFVEIGSSVKKGQTICIIEAMKVMNEFEAEFDCKIEKILVQNGDMVEYGTPLFEVSK